MKIDCFASLLLLLELVKIVKVNVSVSIGGSCCDSEWSNGLLWKSHELLLRAVLTQLIVYLKYIWYMNFDLWL